MPLSQVIANDRAYKLKQDLQRDEQKDASDFVASLLPFGNKRQNKELSSSNSSLSSTSETPNESTSPNTPEPAPRARRRVRWPVFALTPVLGKLKMYSYSLTFCSCENWICSWCSGVCQQTPLMKNVHWACGTLHSLRHCPDSSWSCWCPSFVTSVLHALLNIRQYHHWFWSLVICQSCHTCPLDCEAWGQGPVF